ncbi:MULTISPECIES: extracellular catalytic domain type 2 short-chain-length polyhydroxyalkanoate depolymerase [Paraburkholderia]|jgi:hypothetical protein|uniref:Esterase PHB depolymerase n=1 Tax=Paraburkholderia phenazinium TaxID=60549 RepID=A0A1N6K3L8_9BURK|nr:PHB depolymerase family esterase [Paraburkholderia phenazinium]SIO51169.1 Esterase PHB depolymerase [Paraburkholderia phenazinium]
MKRLLPRSASRLAWLSAVLIPLASIGYAADSTAPLPSYGADLTQTSVSGLSSGAFMAVQFDVAFSNEIVGAGIVAGGPYYCAGLFAPTSPFLAAQTQCMEPLGDSGPQASDALQAARTFARDGLIDDPHGLARQRIYVFSGSMDKTVDRRVVDQTAAFFALAQVPPENIQYQHDIPAGHAFITDRSTDANCGVSAGPYINNCGFEQSHQILRWIYGNLNPPSAGATGRLLPFDQADFDPGHRATLSQTGYVYIPSACDTDTCRVHVVFHGCLQDAQAIGDRYVRGTGYNEMADTNHIIVLYPQVDTSSRNPQGCWDFWGYTGESTRKPDFYSREAPQIAAVMRMVQHLGAPRQ